jgi:hypothetical protein
LMILANPFFFYVSVYTVLSCITRSDPNVPHLVSFLISVSQEESYLDGVVSAWDLSSVGDVNAMTCRAGF